MLQMLKISNVQTPCCSVWNLHSCWIMSGQKANGESNGTPLQYSRLENPMDGGAWWAVVHGVAKGRTRLRDFPFTLHFHALEKEMATHSSVVAWRIPGMAESGGLPSMGSHRVGHDWSDLAAAAAFLFCHFPEWFSLPRHPRWSCLLGGSTYQWREWLGIPKRVTGTPCFTLSHPSLPIYWSSDTGLGTKHLDVNKIPSQDAHGPAEAERTSDQTHWASWVLS